MKIDRLLAIVVLLLNKDKVTATELADRFEVSVRTIQRDIDAINMAGIPIVAYRGQQGGYGIIDEYKIDKNYFTNNEYELLITSLKGVLKAYDDINLRGVMEKLNSINGYGCENRKLIMDFSPWGFSEARKNRINLIKKAVGEQRVICFKYIDNNGSSSERKVEPLSLILKMNAWYLYSYCQLRDDYRLFKISRIRELILTDELFDEHDCDWEGFEFPDHREKTIRLKLRFQASALNRLDYYFDIEELEIKDDGYIYVVLEYPEDEWVYSMILGFGDKVEVLEPPHIKDIIKERAKNILDIYYK